MTTLFGATCASSIPSASLGPKVYYSSGSARFCGSPPGFPLSPLNPSSFWGGSCSYSSSSRLYVPTTATDSSSTTRPTSVITSASLKSDMSKNATPSVTTSSTREARTSPSGMSAVASEGPVVAEEPSTSHHCSRVTSADVKAWKVRRAARKTTRRRALAFGLALAGLTQRGPISSAGVEQEHQLSDSPARDLIRVSQSSVSELPAPTISPASGERYGELVTVSTGSSDSSNNGQIRGLPSWMRGNYHLCMGDGFHVQLPSDWHMNDTQGRLFGTVLRYEDKADPTTNVVVLRSPTSKSRTGSNPDDWIREQAYLLSGSKEPIQFQSGDEGMDDGRKFASGKVSFAKVLNVDKPKYKQGLTYYNYEILTNQGGKQTDALHELVSAVVNNGNLYMCRVQTGEGRWQEDLRNMAQSIVDSFQITGFKINV